MDTKTEVSVPQNSEIKLSVIRTALNEYQVKKVWLGKTQNPEVLVSLQAFCENLKNESDEYILSAENLLKLSQILFSHELEENSLEHLIITTLMKKINFDVIKDIYLYVSSIIHKKNADIEQSNTRFAAKDIDIKSQLVEIDPEWFHVIFQHRTHAKEIFSLFQIAEEAGYEAWLNNDNDLVIYCKEILVLHDHLKKMGFLINREVMLYISRGVKYVGYKRNILSLIKKLQDDNLLEGIDLSGSIEFYFNSVTLICSSGKHIELLESILDELKNLVPLSKEIVLAVCQWMHQLEVDDLLEKSSSESAHSQRDDVFSVINKLKKIDCLNQDIILAICHNEHNIKKLDAALMMQLERMGILTKNTVLAICQSGDYFGYTQELLDVFEYMQKNNLPLYEELSTTICQHAKEVKYIFSLLEEDRQKLTVEHNYYVFQYAHKICEFFSSFYPDLMKDYEDHFRKPLIIICRNLKYFDDIVLVFEKLKKYEAWFEDTVFAVLKDGRHARDIFSFISSLEQSGISLNARLVTCICEFYKNIQDIIFKLTYFFNISISQEMMIAICTNALHSKATLLGLYALYEKGFLDDETALFLCRHGKIAQDIAIAYIYLSDEKIFTPEHKAMINQNYYIAKDTAQILVNLKLQGLLNHYEDIKVDSKIIQQVPLKNRIIERVRANPLCASAVASLFLILPLDKSSYIKICENILYTPDIKILCIKLKSLKLLDKEITTTVLNNLEHLQELSSVVDQYITEKRPLSKYKLLAICQHLGQGWTVASEYPGVMWRSTGEASEESTSKTSESYALNYNNYNKR